jgi:phage protein D
LEVRVPTGYTPIYRIYKGGIDITDHFNDRTTQIKVELTAGGGEGDRCEIVVDDRDWRIARPFGGEQIQIWLGYQEIGLAYMGLYTIDDVIFLGMPRSIQITGTSTGFNDVKKAPQIANFSNKSVGSILGEMAQQSGLQLSISGDLAGRMIPFKNQVVSNLHMIHELERMFGAVGKVVDGKLLFAPRDSTESVSGVSLATLVLHPEHFSTWKVRYSGRNQASEVKAAWWDKDNHMRQWVNSALPGGEGDPFTIGQMFNSQGEAQAAAQAKAQAFKRAEAQADFDLAKGDPWIRDQQTILVTNMRDGINGSYVVDKATHTYVKNTGIRSNLQCRAPGDGVDYSDRADDEFLKPLPGEPMGAVIPDGTFNGPF